MSNAFETFAEDRKPQWQKRREATSTKRAETRAKTAAEKALAEGDELEKLYRAWKRRQADELLAGPYGREVKALVDFLRSLTPSSAPALIKFIERATWIQSAPGDVRHAVLMMVSKAIAKIRTKEGYDPFDDSLPGEEPTAFEVVRPLIRGDA